MTDFYYPQLVDVKAIRQIALLYADNPGYFDDPKCPYPQDVKDIFKGTAAYRDFDTHKEPETDYSQKLNDADTETELNDLYGKMKEYWIQVKDSDKSADKNTYFRVSTTLMEKLVELKERMSNVNKFNSFKSEVLAIMGEVCTADQRNEIIERLEKFKGVQS